MTAEKKTCVYFGPNLSALEKKTFLEECCEECHCLKEKSIMVYDWSPQGFHFEGYYTCPCSLDTDSRDCIYDAEEGNYYD